MDSDAEGVPSEFFDYFKVLNSYSFDYICFIQASQAYIKSSKNHVKYGYGYQWHTSL